MNSVETISWPEIAECSARGSLLLSQARQLKWHQAVSTGEPTRSSEELTFLQVAEPIIGASPPAPGPGSP